MSDSMDAAPSSARADVESAEKFVRRHKWLALFDVFLAFIFFPILVFFGGVSDSYLATFAVIYSLVVVFSMWALRDAKLTLAKARRRERQSKRRR